MKHHDSMRMVIGTGMIPIDIATNRLNVHRLTCVDFLKKLFFPTELIKKITNEVIT